MESFEDYGQKRDITPVTPSHANTDEQRDAEALP